MPDCIVLSDAESHKILIDLKRDNIIAFKNAISKALSDFSTADERLYQPEPAVITRPEEQKILFRPFTSNDSVGIKIIVDRISTAKNHESQSESTQKVIRKPTLHGILAVCDRDGLPKGLINADEMTAYRTAMSVMIPYSWRNNTENVVLFGAGKTALWHIRLALGLRGDEIKRITIVNRSPNGAEALIDQVQRENESRWRSAASFHRLDQSNPQFQQELEMIIADANVIFCATPASNPLFPACYVNQASCFISGIGSWQPEMAEIDPDLFRAASEKGKVVVDDRDGAIRSSGEIIQSMLKAEKITELGALIHMQDRSSESFGIEVERRLKDGLVVYKSVGVSLTDLAAANALLTLAKMGGKGLTLFDF